jgi:hypothetical protein
MGQQQLLLLVLATVIVGLATVAGIQAFDEGQSQATQDALTQRALSIGNDLYSVAQKPSQLGGVTRGGDTKNAASAAGYDTDTDLPADGAGSDAQCDIGTTNGGSDWLVSCSSTSDDSYSSNEYVEVTVGSDGSEVTFINGNDITT